MLFMFALKIWLGIAFTLAPLPRTTYFTSSYYMDGERITYRIETEYDWTGRDVSTKMTYIEGPNWLTENP